MHYKINTRWKIIFLTTNCLKVQLLNYAWIFCQPWDKIYGTCWYLVEQLNLLFGDLSTGVGGKKYHKKKFTQILACFNICNVSNGCNGSDGSIIFNVFNLSDIFIVSNVSTVSKCSKIPNQCILIWKYFTSQYKVLRIYVVFNFTLYLFWIFLYSLNFQL